MQPLCRTTCNHSERSWRGRAIRIQLLWRCRYSVSRRGNVKLTSHLNDNIVQVTFDAPIAGDYVVVITNEFVNDKVAWGLTHAESMVYDKTSVGFKIDFYAPNETYANLDVVLNWVALPV